MPDKHWPNTWTEVEDLGNGKFAASITVGHRVFFDKTDGNKPKKHKLTDNRPNYVLIQSAKCCVEVYPYYAKYFDVQHEEVRLYEERWVVQRWRDPPGNWFDVGAWNPVISVEEYPDVVKVTIIYDTDYGTLTVEYLQRDGSALKHNVTFQNTSGSTETFRVLQRWAGIVGAKVNGKDFPLVTDEPFLAFRKADGKLAIAENLYSMVFNEDGTEKTDQCLQKPISIETHAQGMKADFVYGNWVLAQDESLEIDPDTATLDDPTEDGHVVFHNSTQYKRWSTSDYIQFGGDISTGNSPGVGRGYVEWNVSSLVGATITNTTFKYHGQTHSHDEHIREMVGVQPSTENDDDAGNQAIWDEVGEGTIYASPVGFPVYGASQSIDLGGNANTDLQNQLVSGWFAIGLQASIEDDGYDSRIRAEEQVDADPPPTLYVEYEGVGVDPPTVTTQAVTDIGFD